jgi:hypothetical protein
MSKSRVLIGILGAVFFLTLTSSARADKVHANLFLEKLIYAERHNLTVLDSQGAEAGYLYVGHFENNNGKHLGFGKNDLTVLDSQRVETAYLFAAQFENNDGKHLGFSIVAQQCVPRPGTVKTQPAIVSENPEPTAMVLLGTGLAAVGAFARMKHRKRR